MNRSHTRFVAEIGFIGATGTYQREDTRSGITETT
jgi:hypothetical protein